MYQLDGREDLASKCKICKKKLARDNKNDYCFVHMVEGILEEDRAREETINKYRRKQSYKHYLRKKARSR